MDARLLQSFDSGTSFDISSNHKEACGGGKYIESCRGEIDFRIQGSPHSTVPEQDHIRKKAVRKLIKERCKPTWSKITRSIHSAISRTKDMI